MALAENGFQIPQRNGSLQSQGQTPTIPAQAISADEIALYDRQIRLWGVQAQERIRSANILLISIKALGTEVAKNLILGGIGSITILDPWDVTEDDLGAQFFVREEDIGTNRAAAAATRLQELNPRVKVIADQSQILGRNQNDYAQYDLIVACDLDFVTMTQVNAACRLAGRPFYAAGIHGMYGYLFADLVQHEYFIEREKPNVATQIKAESTTRSVIGVSTKKENGKNIEMVTKREMYSPLLLANTSPLPPEILRNRRKMRSVTPLLPAMRALWDFQREQGRYPSHQQQDLMRYTQLINEKVLELQLPPDSVKSDFLRSFLQNLGSEIVPTAAFVGGRLSEDMINVLGKREQPLQNMGFFDGETFEAPIYALHPIFDVADTGMSAATLPVLPSAVPVDAQVMDGAAIVL